jgi:hypothetical protein
VINELVNDYIARFRPGAAAELQDYRDLNSLEAAISRAALGVDPQGRKHPHQRRIERAALQESKRRLLGHASALKDANSFHQLWQFIGREIGPIGRIGPLAVYDTALRIGAYLSLEPDKVYLHAGTRHGAKALGLQARREWLEMPDLPNALKALSAREAEDFLCIYKAALKATASDPAQHRPVVSGCGLATPPRVIGSDLPAAGRGIEQVLQNVAQGCSTNGLETRGRYADAARGRPVAC